MVLRKKMRRRFSVRCIHSEKKERKEIQSFRSKGANIRLEKKQYRADQETTQTEMSAEIKDLSSGRSTNIETEYRKYDKDKMDSDCDEAVDTKKCPAMKINKKAEDLKPNAYIDVSEADINVFIEIHLSVMVFYVTFKKCIDFGTDVEQLHKESPAKRVRELDRTNRDKLEGGKTENTTYAAEEKLMNHVKRKETRSSEDRDNNDQLSSAGSATLYDLYKLFCSRTFLVEDLIKPNENVFGKTSFIHPLKIASLKLPVNRPAYLPVFAIAFKGGSRIIHAFEDYKNQIIKRILQTHDRRETYLGDEHFRLATFSLSVFNYELGEIIRLAGSGFFCDADGSVKCFCCRNIYRSELLSSHHPDCASRTSDRHAGRSIADHYGESAPGRLVPSGQNVQEEYRTQAFIDIHIRLTTYRLGGTQQFVQDDALAQENELSTLFCKKKT
ncbi:uncharacterized protein LOC123550843 [Mercenaria mercenaria]|uniref:uncharacterized protein LOC123550843 n=1 Tax=Mercenaria mercenaria TaxID=6596 RepID=UPI00234F9C38|nr:uncharacterized protein LOC123550843 [Mercenaria mercenaria]